MRWLAALLLPLLTGASCATFNDQQIIDMTCPALIEPRAVTFVWVPTDTPVEDCRNLGVEVIEGGGCITCWDDEGKHTCSILMAQPGDVRDDVGIHEFKHGYGCVHKEG